jgi:hypothetical protein
MIVYLGIIHPQHYSIQSLLSAPLYDAAFGGMWELDRHSLLKYMNETVLHEWTQKDRLSHTISTLNATVTALNKVGLQAFLDAGTLLGWYRHKGRPIAWDNDGDVAIFGQECLTQYPDQSVLLERLRAEIDPRYYVENFDCHYPPKPGTDFTGVVVDKETGFKIDVFSYNPVDTSKDTFSWRKNKEWLQRDDCKDRHWEVTPKDAIVPLQWGNFSGVVGNIIPNDPKTVLHWDFGAVLEPHIFPHRLNLGISMSLISALCVLLLLVNSGDYTFVLTAVSASLILAGGFRVISLILCVSCIQDRQKGSSSILIFNEVLSYIVIFSLLYDLLPLAPQLFAHTMEALGIPGFTVNPDRYCFLYEVICVDT